MQIAGDDSCTSKFKASNAGGAVQRYQIVHRTYYNFAGDVRLGPHKLLLRPREDHELRIESSSLNIAPTAKVRWHRDVEGNSVAIAEFDGSTAQLLIESDVVIQQYNESPLDFVMADYAIEYPFTYQTGDQILLSPYRVPPAGDAGKSVATWVAEVWNLAQSIETYGLLQRLCSHINQRFSYRVREESGVQSAAQTLALGSGSCRDFSLLFMQAARCLGLASRFVSGYLYVPHASTAGATHAWAEVYLPGAGWKGFDPTAGGIVGADHIAVAVARLAESVPPVSGSFVGASGADLNVGVWVSKCYP